MKIGWNQFEGMYNLQDKTHTHIKLIYRFKSHNIVQQTNMISYNKNLRKGKKPPLYLLKEQRNDPVMQELVRIELGIIADSWSPRSYRVPNHFIQ